jgi:hypothetical protein
MYVVTLVVFSVPCLLMLSAWSRAVKAQQGTPKPDWRMNCLIAALVTGSCMIAAALAFLFSWLHAGGNPHGMGTPPGPWQVLRWVVWSTLLGTIVLAILGKGRGRFLLFAAVVSAILADFAVIMLDFD